jgi:hypothetical protein
MRRHGPARVRKGLRERRVETRAGVPRAAPIRRRYTVSFTDEPQWSPSKRVGFRSRRKWGSGPMEMDVATGDCAGMFQIRSVRAHTAVAPKHNTARGGERHAGVTDAADPAIRERDEVEDSGVASFPASDPPSWWSGR